MDKLRELHDRARTDAQAEQARQDKYYDGHRRPPEFYLGDRVWKENKVLSSAADGISAKLAPKYAGPYTIVNILGENTYEMPPPGGERAPKEGARRGIGGPGGVEQPSSALLHVWRARGKEVEELPQPSSSQGAPESAELSLRAPSKVVLTCFYCFFNKKFQAWG